MFEALGRVTYRRRRWVVALSLLLVAVGGVWGTGVFGSMTGAGFDDPDSDSSRAAEVAERELGRSGGDVVVLYSGDDLTVDDPAFADAVTSTLAALPDDVVTETVSWFDTQAPFLVSEDRSATYAVLTLAGDEDAREAALEAIEDDLAAGFVSDAGPTGWMGADLGQVRPGDTVAVWGAGAVGQVAAKAAELLGAQEVVVIDRLPERLEQARRHMGVETIDYTATDVGAELRERTGGRGPDVCIEAVGMEAHSEGIGYLYDQVKQQLQLQQDRPTAVREAIHACRKGGSVFVLGVFGAFSDKFPLGAVVNKGLTLRGAQMHGQRYIPMLLDRVANGELPTRHFATHPMSLEDAPEGYRLFKDKKDGCVRPVFLPGR